MPTKLARSSYLAPHDGAFALSFAPGDRSNAALPIPANAINLSAVFTAAKSDPAHASCVESTWEDVREPPEAGDPHLHDRTFKWLATLPPPIRPMSAAREFPRIVNRIGDLWPHCEYTRLHFQSLLLDRRSGRRGFPPEVKQELITLQRYYGENLSGLPAILWNAIPVNPRKIPKIIFPRLPSATEIEIPALPA